LAPSESDELSCPGHHSTTLWRARYGDTPPASKFEQAFIAKQAQATKHRVRVNAEHRCQVSRRWEALTWASFAVGNRSTDLTRHLFVKRKRIVTVNLDKKHGITHTSTIVPLSVLTSPPPTEEQPQVLIEKA